MKVWNRVLTSIKRRLSQTLIMFFVVFVLGNVLFAAIAVRQTSTQVENRLRGRVPSIIRISENREKHSSSYEHERLLELVDELAEDKRITGVAKITKLRGARDVHQYDGGISYGYAEFVCINDYSMIDGIEVTSGRNFTEEEFNSGANKIILSESDKWKYSVGDTFALDIYDYKVVEAKRGHNHELIKAKTVEFEVIGFANGFYYNNHGFSHNEIDERIITQSAAVKIRTIQNELLRSHSISDKNYFNQMLVNDSWYCQLRMDKIVIGIQGIDAVDEFETKIKKSDKYVNSSFVLETSANDFRYIQAPLENLKALTNVTMISSTVLVIVLLGLVSILFIRNRTKEVGILMALGERKSKLFTQFILEIILVGMLSATCAMISGNKLGAFISNEFMRIQIDAEAEIEYGEDNKGAITQLDMLEEYKVELNVEYIVTIYGASFVILLVSSLIPMAFVLRTNPKKVLL